MGKAIIQSTQESYLSTFKNQIKGEVQGDAYSLGLYATDASVYQMTPKVIITPKDEADVLTALKIAREHKLNVLPRGGGTSLAGQTVGDDLVLDFSRHMNQVLELNVEEKWVRVQPGMVRDELNAFLKPHGLHFAPDPATSSRANVGGMIGNNSSGTKSILYGKTVDHVSGLKVALADGQVLNLEEKTQGEIERLTQINTQEGRLYKRFSELIHTHHAEIEARFPKVMRRVGGYNLDEFPLHQNWNLGKLLCGSEGTLGVSLECKLNLEPLPAYKSVCVVHFAEVLEAITAVEPMLDFQPAAVEILDRTVLNLSRENLTTKRACHFLEGDAAAILIVEFYSDSFEDVMDRPRQMIQMLEEKGLGYAYPLFPEGQAYEDVWLIRKKGLGLMLGLKGEAKPLPFIEDSGIPVEVLPEYIERVLKLCEENETPVAMYAHASVGVIHVRPILDLRKEVEIERFKAISEGTFKMVQEYGGSWSGEHGDGLVRSFYNEQYFGTELYQVFKEIKSLFDPENRMNPGKIVDSPPIDQHLRYGAKYKDLEPQTTFHYRKDESFGAAVHMCTGVGECRKMLGGTMCPSFKATRNEEDSTRGRANALRLAMSGQLEGGLESDRLQEVMDLCLSCKACKSECPSNVDMAKLKSEVRQIHLDKYGASLRDLLIRDSANSARIFSGVLAPFINFIQKTFVFRWGLEKVGGFDKKRVLPAYASQSFADWFRSRGKQGRGELGEVVLFADTYLNYHEPHIGKAATKLLEDCGYGVLLADVGCCQRPRISNGFLREAKEAGSHMARKLKAYLDQDLPILVCEPSCTSALVDDLPDLLDDEKLASQLSSQVKMIDVFLAEEKREGRLSVDIQPKAKSLLHGHCHQKAMFGTDAIKSFSTEIEEIPSGCCGMAGSFGYEKEHYEISKKIGGEVLFPVVQENPDKNIIACGVSCRHQLSHFTETKALHWVEAVEVRDSTLVN
ncbi:MAG: FAD-linked oxidase C-terminal domain-containing protein [Bacteroidota bacterium]